MDIEAKRNPATIADVPNTPCANIGMTELIAIVAIPTMIEVIFGNSISDDFNSLNGMIGFSARRSAITKKIKMIKEIKIIPKNLKSFIAHVFPASNNGISRKDMAVIKRIEPAKSILIFGEVLTDPIAACLVDD